MPAMAWIAPWRSRGQRRDWSSDFSQSGADFGDGLPWAKTGCWSLPTLQVAPSKQTVQKGTMRFGKIHLHAAPCRAERTCPAADGLALLSAASGQACTFSPAHPPAEPVQQLRGRGIAGGGQRVRAGQVLPLEAREPGLDRCKPRVLFPQLLGFAPQLLGFVPQLLHPLLVLHHSLLVAGIPSPVERRQPQAPSRQR